MNKINSSPVATSIEIVVATNLHLPPATFAIKSKLEEQSTENE